MFRATGQLLCFFLAHTLLAYWRGLLACVLTRRSFAMSFISIANPLACCLHGFKQPFLWPGSDWLGQRGSLWAFQATYRRVSVPSLACPASPKVTKLPDGPVRA